MPQGLPLLLFLLVAVLTPSFKFANPEQKDDDVQEDADAKPTENQDTPQEASDPAFTAADLSTLSKGEVAGHQFKAEINQLMGIIVNSLYSNRDIFVRELVSNAADALDKIRYLSLTNPALLKDNKDLEIKIKVDTENKLIHIRDTGLGMTREDLVNNLGSIAKSGTKEFLKKMDTGKQDVNQIGQFGVGFYSSFLVADKVTVTSKHNDDEQYIWESALDDSTAFSVAKDPRGNTLGRGTLITLHMRDDATEYLSFSKLKSLVEHYNQFITFPISILEEVQVPVDEPAPADDDKDEDETKEGVDLEVEELEESEPAEKKTKTVQQWKQINSVQPLWTRKSSDISKEEYIKFYQDSLDSSGKPIHWTHFKTEGDVEFSSLLYVPSAPPAGAMDFLKSHSLVKMYVKRVFISDTFEDFLPPWLNFIRGIVDSDDLPLNVSREMLQQNKLLQTIQKKLVRKIIALLQEIMGNEEKWREFYDNYHQFIKMGIIKDNSNRHRLAKLLRYNSAKNPEEYISLEKYVENMKSGQNEIYYLGGENKEALLRSPLIERLVKKGYDVLLFTSPIDEYTALHLGTYDSKYKLVDIGKEGLKLDADDKVKQEEFTKEFTPLIDYLKTTLKKSISSVEISVKLASSPCALVSGSYAMSANMERILKAQALADKSQSSGLGAKKVLEINPRHPIIKHLLTVVENGEQNESTEDIANMLYDTAALTSGYTLENPQNLAARLNKLVATSLNIDPDASAEEEVYSEEKETESTEQVKDDEKEDNAEHVDL